jgi:hypothetical protein
MRKSNYVFKFYDLETKTFYTLKNDIDEWQSFGVSFGREKEKSTIVKSYSANFTFIKEDANYLKNIIYTRGFNVRIAIYVYTADMFGTLTTTYRGFLDLTNAEITNVFKCPIYAGGFYNALDNNWSEKYSLSPKVLQKVGVRDFEVSAFENIEFNGGTYKYEEVLGIENNAKVTLQGTVYGSPSNTYYANFLPIKIKNENKNSKLKYFKDASSAAVDDSTNGVSQNSCFVYAKNKLNAGKFTFSVNNCGNIYIHDVENYMEGQHHASEIVKISIGCRFGVYIYNEIIGSEAWYPNANLLNGTRTSSLDNTYKPSTMKSLRSYTNLHKYYTNENGNSIAHIKISDIDLSHNQNDEFNLITTNTYDFSWIKDENASSGMYIAIGIDYLYFNFYDSNNYVIGGNDIKSDLEFEFTDNFEIKYSNENFIINRKKFIHGIQMKYLFTELMNKINVKQYNLNIDTTELEAATSDVMLFSNIGLIGTTNLVYENGVFPVISTSISDLLDCLYKVFALRFYCTYNIDTNTYTIKFVKVKNTYQDVKIDTLLNVNNIVVAPDRDNAFSSVVAGYENESDSIFGRYEFNCKNTFKTSNTEIESKEFDLVSRYKAGALDIETFIHANYGNFEDKTNDGGNIYLLEVFNRKNNTYTINSDVIKKTINCHLTPSTIIANHYKELAGMLYFDKKLTFIATTGNADFVYRRKENDDVTILEEHYNLPFICTIEVPAVTDLIPKIEANPLGYFEFTYNDKIYRGYIAEGTESLTINPMNEQSSVLRLLLTNTSEL